MNLRTTLVAGAAAAAMIGGGLAASPAAGAATTPNWAPAATAGIHPGTQTFTEGGQCTANYVFYDATDIYIGQAAHCSGEGAQTDTNGCTTPTLPIGTTVEVDGADFPGTLAYSSWNTMQAVGETDADTCAYNDFSLIRLDPRDHDNVNPSIPVWGGPVGIGDATDFGEQVYSVGNSSLRQGIELLSPKTGISLGTTGGGWTHPLYTLTPGIPGDSGSAFLDSEGKAIGVLSTLAIAPTPLSNNVSDIGLALDYLDEHGNLDVTLANGTEPFTGPSGIFGILGGL